MTPSPSADPVDFFRARLDEDDEVAQATRKNEQFVYGTDRWFASHSNAITSMAPHRAVAEVAAKREVIRLYEDTLEMIEMLKAHGQKTAAHEVAAESYLNVIRAHVAAYSGQVDRRHELRA